MAHVDEATCLPLALHDMLTSMPASASRECEVNSLVLKMHPLQSAIPLLIRQIHNSLVATIVPILSRLYHFGAVSICLSKTDRPCVTETLITSLRGL